MSSKDRESVQDVYCCTRTGVVLLQEEDDKEFLVAYVSWHLLDAETRYVFKEKFCLSLYHGAPSLRIISFLVLA
jgi:hypothetical protein